jgi:hypothetical protein
MNTVTKSDGTSPRPLTLSPNTMIAIGMSASPRHSSRPSASPSASSGSGLTTITTPSKTSTPPASNGKKPGPIRAAVPIG